MARASHVAKDVVDRIARRHMEADDDAAAQVAAPVPGGIPELGKRRRVQFEGAPSLDRVLDRVDVMDAARRAPDAFFGNLDTEPAIEGDRSGGVAAHDVELIETRLDGQTAQSRWTHMAMPMPPPMHRVARPFLASRFCIS